MFGFGQLIEILKKDPKKIVFTEEGSRILEAASRLLASNFLHPILVGDPEKISASAEKSGFNIRGAEIIDPMNFDRMDEMVELFCELRKSKGVTPEQAKGILSSANYFGTMLVKMGVADSLLGGATYSTADTVRPALQLIKTKPEMLSFLHALSLFVHLLQVRMRFLQWVTVLSISIQQRMSLLKSPEKQQSVLRSSVSIQRLHS